jgi:hypothetical protein
MRPSRLEYKAVRRAVASTPGTGCNNRLGRTSEGLRGGRARLALSFPPRTGRSEGLEYPPPLAAESRRFPDRGIADLGEGA